MSLFEAPARLCGLALLFGALAAAGEKPAPEHAPADLGEAARLAAEGQSAAALALSAKLVAAAPQDLAAQRLYQDLMLAAGRREELLAGYKALGNQPGLRPAVFYLSARAEQAPAERRKRLEALAGREPNHFWAIYDLVPLCVSAGDLAAAEKWARAARDLRPKDPDVRNVLGDVLLQAGKPKEAEAELNEALRLRPVFPQAHYNLGLARAAAGALQEAAALFAKAAGEDPRCAEAFNNLGHCLARLNQPDEAIAAYRQAVAARPDYGAAWNNLAVALYRQNDFAGAWAALSQAEKSGYAVAPSFKRVLAKKLFPEKEKN